MPPNKDCAQRFRQSLRATLDSAVPSSETAGMTTPLALTDTVPEAAREAILAGIRAHNDTLLGPTDRRELFIPITAENGSVDGGLIGYTGRGWL